MLQLRANKKLLREQLEVQSNKAVTLRDLSNLAARKKQGCSRNDLEATVKLLQNKYASTVRLLTGENNELRAIFFQDDAMRRSFEDYPEIIFIDATYKLLETRMSCFLMLVEDGNGESEIVAVGLFGVEDGDTLRWFFNVFKELNKSWNSVKITMADKDLKERRIVTELLPQSSLHICAFHTLQTFRREISVQKLGITKPAQETALDILQHMVYAKDDDEYQRLHETLKSSSPKAVLDYFESNWHGIHQEWVMGMKQSCGNYLNSTNNRAESINAKLKAIVERYSSLEDFVTNFFCFIHTTRKERTNKAAALFNKKRVITNGDKDLELYSQLLTPYAFKHVERHLRISNGLSVDAHSVASASDCTCGFRRAMLLPCCHMLAARGQLGLSKFDHSMCAQRWTSEHYNKSRGVLLAAEQEEPEPVIVDKQDSRPILSSHQKFRKASMVAGRIAGVMSEVSMAEFQRRMETLENLLQHWMVGNDVRLETNASEIGAQDDHGASASSVAHEPCPMYPEPPKTPGNTDVVPCTSAAAEVSPDPPQTRLPEVTEVQRANDASLWTVAPAEVTETSHVRTAQVPEVASHGDGLDQSAKEHREQPASFCTTLKDIKLAPPMRKCGRPKGNTLTVIGLPRKSKRARERGPFRSLPIFEKKTAILTWLVGSDAATSALKGRLLEEEDVETRPELVHCGILDESVDISIVRSFFTDDAWRVVTSTQNVKKSRHCWLCHACHGNLEDLDAIMCDWCLNWFHLPCTSLKRQPKKKLWQCAQCG